jgi:hypothetical protein
MSVYRCRLTEWDWRPEQTINNVYSGQLQVAFTILPCSSSSIPMLLCLPRSSKELVSATFKDQDFPSSWDHRSEIHYSRFTSILQDFCTSPISSVTDLVKQEMSWQTRLVPVSQSADALNQTCIISAELLSERFEFWMFRVSGARRSIQRQGGNPSTPTAQVLELLHFYLYSGNTISSSTPIQYILLH